MAKLSISKAWDETKDVLGRDGKLLATVAAALLLLPQVVASVATGQVPGGETSQFGWLVAIGAIISVIGQLAISWQALGRGGTVGEAIRHGARRFLPFFGAMLILILIVAIIGAVAAAILIGAGVIEPRGEDPSAGDVLAVILLAAVPMLYISVRLLPNVPVASAESGGPIAILKRSWGLTRGHAGRLAVFLLGFAVAAIVLLLAVAAVGGLLVQLLFGAAEPFSIGALVNALINGTVQAGIVLVYVVMLTRIYVQLAGGGAGAGEVEASVPSSAD